MKPLKYEIEAVSQILDQGPGNLSDVALLAIQALDRARSQHQHYGLLFAEGSTYICVGPFRTVKQVETWAAKNGHAFAVRVVLRAPTYEEGG